MAAPVDIQVQVLNAGFDIAFFGALVAGIVILVLVLLTRLEIHPDYLDREEREEVPMGMM